MRRSRNLYRAANLAAYTAGWWACALAAADGRPWLGTLAVVSLLALQLALAPSPGRSLRLGLAGGGLGFVVDSAQGWAGVLAFPGAPLAVWLCPPWLVALWVLFATTLGASLDWLQGRPVLAAGLGAIGGAGAYWGGAALGALTLHPQPAWSLGVLAGVWLVTLPVLAALAARLDPAPGQAPTLAPAAAVAGLPPSAG